MRALRCLLLIAQLREFDLTAAAFGYAECDGQFRKGG